MSIALLTPEKIYENSLDSVNLIMAETRPEWVFTDAQYLEALQANKEVLVKLIANPDFQQFELEPVQEAIQEADRKISILQSNP
jgi:hypothetical protein